MATSDQIWIRSNKFAIQPGEDSKTNPGVYGKSLAEWLVDRLREVGEPAIDCFPEDWGWCIVLNKEPYSFIGCANRWEQTEEWGIFIDVREGFLKKIFGGGDAKTEVKRLQSLLQRVLEGSNEIEEVTLESIP